MGLVDVDKEDWLYDQTLFNDTNDSNKIFLFLIDRGLISDEILDKIENGL